MKASRKSLHHALVRNARRDRDNRRVTLENEQIVRDMLVRLAKATEFHDQLQMTDEFVLQRRVFIIVYGRPAWRELFDRLVREQELEGYFSDVKAMRDHDERLD